LCDDGSRPSSVRLSVPTEQLQHAPHLAPSKPFQAGRLKSTNVRRLLVRSARRYVLVLLHLRLPFLAPASVRQRLRRRARTGLVRARGVSGAKPPPAPVARRRAFVENTRAPSLELAHDTLNLGHNDERPTPANNPFARSKSRDRFLSVAGAIQNWRVLLLDEEASSRASLPAGALRSRRIPPARRRAACMVLGQVRQHARDVARRWCQSQMILRTQSASIVSSEPRLKGLQPRQISVLAPRSADSQLLVEVAREHAATDDKRRR
jgi:hypothetical protein